MTLNFQTLFRDLPNAYMLLDRDMRYIDANRAYERITGVARADLIGRSIFEVFPGTVTGDGTDESAALRTSLMRVLQTGERDVLALIPYTLPAQHGNAAGETRFWSASHEPVRDENGNVFAILQHTSDVTEVERLRNEVQLTRALTGQTEAQVTSDVLSRAATVQRANERLSVRQTFLTDLFEQAPGFMAVLRGPDHVFELANSAYSRLVGNRPLIGRSVREALPELEGQGFYELLDQVRLSGRPFIGRGMPVQLEGEDGVIRTSNVDFIYQPVSAVTGLVDAIFIQGADVTDREQLLAQVRFSEARFRAITNLVPQMVWTADEAGRPDYFNQRWYEITGVPAGGSVGDAWLEVLHPEDRAGAVMKWTESVANRQPYEVEYRVRHVDGKYRWWLARGIPVLDHSDDSVRWMGTCTDIDEMKLVKDMLVTSQTALRVADAQKDRFLAMLAHELRNPLTPISNAAQMLKMAPDRAETVIRAADIIHRQAGHIREMVEDLVDLSRVTRGIVTLNPRSIMLGDVVSLAIEQVSPSIQEKGLNLHLSDQLGDETLTGDPVRLTQVVTNLLNNAAKFTPEGGEIRVALSRQKDDAVLRVTDTGVGMDQSLMSRMFELFVQAENSQVRNEGGLGVGLAIAKSLVNLHGGDLTARSGGIGLGSTFEMRLPLRSRSELKKCVDSDGAYDSEPA